MKRISETTIGTRLLDGGTIERLLFSVEFEFVSSSQWYLISHLPCLTNSYILFFSQKQLLDFQLSY